MKPFVQPRSFRFTGLLAALALTLTAGCSKEEEVDTAATDAATDAAAEVETVATEPEESTTDAVPGASEGVAQVDVRATMNAADAALKQNDLEKATDALLKLQLSGALKNNQQAAVDHYQRMVELQQKIADASVSGDPKAERAAALLRQSSGVR